MKNSSSLLKRLFQTVSCCRARTQFTISITPCATFPHSPGGLQIDAGKVLRKRVSPDARVDSYCLILEKTVCVKNFHLTYPKRSQSILVIKAFDAEYVLGDG